MAPPPAAAALEDLAGKVLEPLSKATQGLAEALKDLVPPNFGTDYSFPVYRQQGWQPATFPYLEVIVIFSLVFFFFETWLSIRNHRKIHIKKPPEAVSRSHCHHALLSRS